MEKKRFGRTIIIISVLILIALVLIIYLNYIFSQKCEDIYCFNAKLEKCEKASYLNEAEEAVWFYEVMEKIADGCHVRVELKYLKEGTADMEILEGKKMDCYLPSGIVAKPEDNLEYCHGLLKEEIQTLTIKRLHSYIVSNLGEISEELKKVV